MRTSSVREVEIVLWLGNRVNRKGETIMANFNEHSLEMSIMDLFQDEDYIYLNGEQIHRERSEVLLIDD